MDEETKTYGPKLESGRLRIQIQFELSFTCFHSSFDYNQIPLPL